MTTRNAIKTLLPAILLFVSLASRADAVQLLLQEYRDRLGAHTVFDAERGSALWYADRNSRSCTTCHGDSPVDTGRHERTGKPIEPMARSINPTRLTKTREIEKWFLRNCKWTLGRECTVREKGDLLTWLIQF